MHYEEVTNKILEKELYQTDAATPKKTVNRELNKHPEFKQVSLGKFDLRDEKSDEYTSDPKVEEESEFEASGEESGIVQAFGMYWERDRVKWTSSPSIYGRQGEDAKKVDFSKQKGVYLLHDDHRVIYVGKTVDTLGSRLYYHTKNRHRGRWNRFSWFGLLDVNQNGDLIKELDLDPDLEKISATLESILIESVEPVQNRQRGDGFNAIEYLQAEDPSFKDEELIETIERIKDRIV